MSWLLSWHTAFSTIVEVMWILHLLLRYRETHYSEKMRAGTYSRIASWQLCTLLLARLWEWDDSTGISFYRYHFFLANAGEAFAISITLCENLAVDIKKKTRQNVAHFLSFSPSLLSLTPYSLVLCLPLWAFGTLSASWLRRLWGGTIGGGVDRLQQSGLASPRGFSGSVSGKGQWSPVR